MVLTGTPGPELLAKITSEEVMCVTFLFSSVINNLINNVQEID